MKRKDFIAKMPKRLEPVPRRMSMAGKRMGEKEASLTEDIIFDMEPHQFMISEFVDPLKIKFRYKGNTYTVTSFHNEPGSLSMIAKAEVWHEPIEIPRT